MSNSSHRFLDRLRSHLFCAGILGLVAVLPVSAQAQAVFGPDFRANSGPGTSVSRGGNFAPGGGSNQVAVAPAAPASGVGPAAGARNIPANGPGAANANGGPGDNYIISTNDSIRVEVYQEDDMTTVARVNKEGLITMPLLGQVKVAGMTAQDTAAKLRSLLSKDFFVNPLVNVTIVDFTAKRFFLFGQVRSPGTYTIPPQESVDLVQAIAMAGGFTTTAAPGRITVVRRDGGKEETFKVDARRMTKDSREKPFEVKPGDVINVPESIF